VERATTRLSFSVHRGTGILPGWLFHDSPQRQSVSFRQNSSGLVVIQQMLLQPKNSFVHRIVGLTVIYEFLVWIRIHPLYKYFSMWTLKIVSSPFILFFKALCRIYFIFISLHCKYDVANTASCTFNETASVVYWSEFLVTDPEARVRFSARLKKKVVGLERGPLSLVSTTEELLDRKVAAPV
jgi:hypothetical protein